MTMINEISDDLRHYTESNLLILLRFTEREDLKKDLQCILFSV